MSGWIRYLELTVRSKTGLSSTVVGWAMIAAVCAAVTFVLLILAAFVWLAEVYTPLTAALILAGFFMCAAVVAAAACVMLQRRTVTDAKLALAARSNMPWLDARYMLLGLQIGRSIGWRRIVPIAAAGLLAAGLAREWLAHDKPPEEESAEG